jgi:hypothetical protein
MTADEVLEEFLLDPCFIDCPASDCINERRMADEIVRLRDEMNHARALLIDLKRYRDEAERSRPIIQAAQAYLDSGGNYTSWLALRQLLPLSPSSPYAT